MRTWERARLAESCGNCSVRLPPETPILVVTLPQLEPVTRRRVRCVSCAKAYFDEQQPNQAQLDAWDEAAERAAIVSDGAPTPYRFTGVTSPLPFDAKAAQAGKDAA